MTKTIEHQGIIISMNSQTAIVRIEQTSACSGCHAKAACTASDSQEREIEAFLTDNSLKVGDSVIVYGAQNLGFKAVLWAFVIPFCLILAITALMVALNLSETISGCIGLAILFPYYFILWLLRGKIKKEFQFFVRR